MQNSSDARKGVSAGAWLVTLLQGREQTGSASGSASRGRAHAMYMTLALVVALVLTACGGGGSASPKADGAPSGKVTTVRFGTIGGLSDAGIYLATAFGYFKAEGIEVATSHVLTTDTTAALASGHLDVAGIATSAGMYNAVRSGLGIVMVGDKKSVDAKHSDNQLVVTKNLVVKNDVRATVHNLVGKRVAVSSKVSSAYKVLVDVANHYGVDVKKINVVEMAYADVAAAFANGAIDGALVIEPFLSKMITLAKNLSVVENVVAEATVAELPKGEERALIVPLVFSADFAANRQVAQRFMVAYMRGVRLYTDAVNGGAVHKAVYDVIAKQTGLGRQLLEHAYMPAFDVNQTLSPLYFEDLQKWFISNGVLKTPIDVNKMMDTSFAVAALKELGPYEPK